MPALVGGGIKMDKGAVDSYNGYDVVKRGGKYVCMRRTALGRERFLGNYYDIAGAGESQFEVSYFDDVKSARDFIDECYAANAGDPRNAIRQTDFNTPFLVLTLIFAVAVIFSLAYGLG